MKATLTTLCRNCGEVMAPQLAAYSIQVLRYQGRLLHVGDVLQWANEKGPLCQRCLKELRKSARSAN